MANKLIVSAAPHITSADSTSKIMGRVCIALLPTLIASVLIFGFQALLLTAVTVAACVVFEYAYCKLVGRDVTISDLSAVVTGLLLAFNLPAGLPVWMSLVGAFIAIVIIKQLFGGLGYNFAKDVYKRQVEGDEPGKVSYVRTLRFESPKWSSDFNNRVGYIGDNGVPGGVAVDGDGKLRSRVTLEAVEGVSRSDFFVSNGASYVNAGGKVYQAACLLYTSLLPALPGRKAPSHQLQPIGQKNF